MILNNKNDNKNRTTLNKLLWLNAACRHLEFYQGGFGCVERTAIYCKLIVKFQKRCNLMQLKRFTVKSIVFFPSFSTVMDRIWKWTSVNLNAWNVQIYFCRFILSILMLVNWQRVLKCIKFIHERRAITRNTNIKAFYILLQLLS